MSGSTSCSDDPKGWFLLNNTLVVQGIKGLNYCPVPWGSKQTIISQKDPYEPTSIIECRSFFKVHLDLLKVLFTLYRGIHHHFAPPIRKNLFGTFSPCIVHKQIQDFCRSTSGSESYRSNVLNRIQFMIQPQGLNTLPLKHDCIQNWNFLGQELISRFSVKLRGGFGSLELLM